MKVLNKYWAAFAALMIAMVGYIAFAQEAIPGEPDSVGEVVKLVPVIVGAFKSGSFLMAGAGIALIVTYIFRRAVLPKIKLGSGVLPIVSALVGCFAGVSVAILGGANLLEASLAVMSGPLASVLWDAVIKYFLPKSA